MKTRISVYLEPNDVRQLSALATTEERQLPAQAAYIIKQHLKAIALPKCAEAESAEDMTLHPQGAQLS